MLLLGLYMQYSFFITSIRAGLASFLPGTHLGKQTGLTLYRYACFWFVCLGVVVSASAVQAQSAAFSDTWYRGSVILTEGDSLSGDIHYDLQNNLLQINAGNALKAYSARQIWSFSFYDPDMMTDRHFYALPYSVEANYKAPVLFELLSEGEVSLLSREKLVTENVPQYGYGGFGNYSYLRTRLRRDYFLGFANGNIKSYDGTKRDLLYLLKDKSSEVKKFANTNRLRYDDKGDLIQIINYYNSLKK